MQAVTNFLSNPFVAELAAGTAVAWYFTRRPDISISTVMLLAIAEIASVVLFGGTKQFANVAGLLLARTFSLAVSGVIVKGLLHKMSGNSGNRERIVTAAIASSLAVLAMRVVWFNGSTVLFPSVFPRSV